MPYTSKRQARWAHATGHPFARRWDKLTSFSGLPEHKDAGADAGASLHGPGGLLSTPGLGARRPRKGRKWGQRTKDYSARAGGTIQGNLGRAQDGKFTRVGSNPDAPPSFGRAAKKPKKGRAARARKPKLTPEQRAQATTAKRQQNAAAKRQAAQARREAVAARRAAKQPGAKPTTTITTTTAQPSSAIAGAVQGLAHAAGSKPKHKKKRKPAMPNSTAPAAPAKARTKAAGGPGDYLIVEDPQKSSTWHLQVKRNGKADHGLMGSAWAALHSGFRGNVYQGPGKAEALAKLKKLYASEKMSTPAEKSFVVYKDASGRDRWLARTTTAYKDRDGEIISEAALDSDSQRMTASKTFGPLRWWHVGDPDPLAVDAPWGPGLDIGDCDYSVVIGRTRVESGTFRDAAVARKVAQAADGLEMSPGFFHPLDQPDSAGVFHSIRTFERSVVPVRYGRASNLFTGFTVKEFRMDIAEMEKRFKAMYTELGLTPEQAQAFGQQLVATEKAATAQGIAYKDAETDYPDVVINGVTYKAAPPPPPAATPAAGAPIEGSPEEEAAESPEEEAAEPDAQDGMQGDYIGDMSTDDFKAMLAEMLAPVLKMQDMVKSIGDMHGELKGMYGGVATKDDARAQELITLKVQMTDLAAKIAQIEGNQPATILPDEVAAALKSAGPAKPAVPDDPAKQAALSDPSRPLAWLGMQTFPELYQNGENT